jgi:hypothetical protein
MQECRAESIYIILRYGFESSSDIDSTIQFLEEP